MDSTYFINELEVGMSDSLSKTVTEKDLVFFSGLAGSCTDKALNTPHLAQGMVSADFISTVLTTKLPGSASLYLGHSMQFKALVRVGDRVTTKVTVSNIDLKSNVVTLETLCTIKDKIIVTGKQLTLVKQANFH